MRRYLIVLILLLGGTLSASAQPLENRSRLEIRGGSWTPKDTQPTNGIQNNVGGMMGVWIWTHWTRETLAIEVTLSSVFADISPAEGAQNFGTNWVMLHSFMVGLRKDLTASRVRPYLTADAGFVLIYGLHTGFGSYPTGADFTPALRLSSGIDFRLGKRWMLGATAGYYGMRALSEPIGGIHNYTGPELSVGISRLLGD